MESLQMNQTFLEYFTPAIKKIQSHFEKYVDEINSTNVYRAGIPEFRKIICDVAEGLMLPGSGLRNAEQFIELYQRAKRSESCLIMMEHFSNFDFPAIVRFFEKHPDLGPDAADALLPIQAYKLTSGNRATPVLSAAFSTITIYPSRHIDQIEDPEELKRVRAISTPMNLAAIGEMTRRKYKGRIILVFPAGTRYRPWAPESKKAVREAESYLRVFQNVLFVSINGFCLVPSQDENMENDAVQKSVVLMTGSEIYNGKEVRHSFLPSDEEILDKKKVKELVCEGIMGKINELHEGTLPVFNKLMDEALKSLDPEA